MDRQAALLLALGLLIAAAASVSASGWILFVRDRRAGRHAPIVPRETDEEPNAESASPPD